MREEAAIDRAWWAMLSSKCCCINKGRLLVFSFSGRTSRSESDPRPIKRRASQSHKGQEDSTCKRYSTGTRTIMTRRGTVRITRASQLCGSLLQRLHVKCYLRKTEDGMHNLMSARRVYGNIAAGSKILSQILRSWDQATM